MMDLTETPFVCEVCAKSKKNWYGPCPHAPAAPPAPSEQQEWLEQNGVCEPAATDRLEEIRHFVELAASERSQLPYWNKCEGNETLCANAFLYCQLLLLRLDAARAALTEIADNDDDGSLNANWARDIARDALGEPTR